MTTFPLASPIYQPAMRLISNITQANPAVITTTQNHLYVSGTIVRIDIPPFTGGNTNTGMQQMNQQFGPITVLSPTTFSIPIDSTQFAAFVAGSTQFPQAVPIGELTEQLNAAVQNTLVPL